MPMSPVVAEALHPAVLRLMMSVAEGAALRDRHVSVCGDAASDPAAAAAFAGLGIHSLSVRPNQAATIKAHFRSLELSRLKDLATRALQMSSAVEVRRLLSGYLNSADQAK